jgi:hypothetical protein
MSEIKHTPGPWEIDWYICTANASDVKHAEKNGKEMTIGDELWRVPISIGPVTADHNHWAGWHLNADDDDARLIAAAPELLEALMEARAFILSEYEDEESKALDGEVVSRDARPIWNTIHDAIAKAEGRS